MSAGYTTCNLADVALTAATAKTVLNLINSANGLIRLCEIGIGFDGVTSTAEPVVVELCSSTQGAAGTATTSAAPVQFRGPTRAPLATAGQNYTAEPTTLTVIKTWLVRADGGSLVIQFPLGREPEQVVTADGLCLRCTAPANVNARAYLEHEEG